MKKFLIPVILTILGAGAGLGAGYVLGPKAPEQAAQTEEGTSAQTPENQTENAAEIPNDNHLLPSDNANYFKIQNQFIVPIIHHGKMTGMVLMSLAIEADPSLRDTIFKHEPKLRDAFLRVMFDHANIGGFDGNFTESGPMQLLDESLLRVAQGMIGNGIRDVLILEIARQELS